MAKIKDGVGEAITDQDGHGIYDEAGITEEITAAITIGGVLTRSVIANRSSTGDL